MQVSEGYSGVAVCHTCAFKATMIVWDCWVCLCAALFISSHRGTKAANSSHTSALSLMSLTFIKRVWLPLWWCHSRIMNEGVSSEEKGTWEQEHDSPHPPQRVLVTGCFSRYLPLSPRDKHCRGTFLNSLGPWRMCWSCQTLCTPDRSLADDMLLIFLFSEALNIISI